FPGLVAFQGQRDALGLDLGANLSHRHPALPKAGYSWCRHGGGRVAVRRFPKIPVPEILIAAGSERQAHDGGERCNEERFASTGHERWLSLRLDLHERRVGVM